MTRKIDFERINKDFLAMLEKHGFHPESFGISLTLSKDDFDALVTQHSELSPHPGIILTMATEINGLQWSMQILREFDIEDFQR